MKYTIVLFIAFISFQSLAQDCNLLTDTSIYWPAVSFSKPDYLEQNITEPTFGTNITRIVGNPGDTILNLSGEVWANEQERHGYSKRQPWNSDQSMIFLDRHNPELWLDGETYEVLFTRSKPSSRVRWSHTEPNIMNFVYSGNPSYVGKWDVVEDTTTSIVNFSGYSSCSFGKGEGNFTNDGSKVAIVAVRDSDNHEVIFVVDIIAQTKGLDIDVDSFPTISNCTISPLGNYIIIVGDFGSGSDRVQVRDAITGTILWTETLYGLPSHFDTQIDQNGDEIIAGVAKSSPQGYDYNGKVIKRRLSDGVITVISNFSWASHTSGRALNRPGWVFVSYQNRSGSSHYPYYNELVAVKLDGTRTERICHLYAIKFTYVAESHGVPSPNGLRTMWASDWENNAYPVQAYVADFRDKVLYNLNVDIIGQGNVSPLSGTYLTGDTVVLSAIPDTGYQFVSWTGDTISGLDTITVIMNSNMNITATFTEIVTTINNYKPIDNFSISCYPNPFSLFTEIDFHLPYSGKLKISIYDIKGNELCVLADEIFNRGDHSFIWDTKGIVPNGIYFVKTFYDNSISVNKLLLIK